MFGCRKKMHTNLTTRYIQSNPERPAGPHRLGGSSPVSPRLSPFLGRVQLPTFQRRRDHHRVISRVCRARSPRSRYSMEQQRGEQQLGVETVIWTGSLINASCSIFHGQEKHGRYCMIQLLQCTPAACILVYTLLLIEYYYTLFVYI